MNNTIFERYACPNTPTIIALGESRTKGVEIVVILTCTINGLLIPPATIFNMLFIISIVRRTHLQTPSNVLLVFLAVTDFLCGAVSQPLFIKVYSDSRYDVIDCTVMQVMVTVGRLLTGLSQVTLAVITIDRFLVLHYPFRYIPWITIPRLVQTTAISWFIMLIITLLPYLGVDPRVSIVFIYSYFTGALYFLIILLNLKIMMLAHRQNMQIIALERNIIPTEVNQAREKKIAKTMGILLMGLTVCYIPFIICSVLLGMSEKGKTSDVFVFQILPITTTLLHANSSLNPGIYMWRQKDVKKEVLALLKRE